MSISLLSTLGSVSADLALVGGITSLLEAVFKPLDMETPRGDFMIIGETIGQAFLSVTLYLEGRSLLSRVYQDDPTGSMAAFGAMFPLQPNLLRKIVYLRGRASTIISNATSTSTATSA